MFITKDELNKGMYNYMYIKYEKYFNYNLNKYINTYIYAHKCIRRKSTNIRLQNYVLFQFASL